jgi:hypothetical protein
MYSFFFIIKVPILTYRLLSEKCITQRWRHTMSRIRLNWFLNDSLAALGNRQVEKFV